MTYNVNFNLPGLGTFTVPVTADDMKGALEEGKKILRDELGDVVADAIGSGSVSTRMCGE